jgi:hypothetical protein
MVLLLVCVQVSVFRSWSCYLCLGLIDGPVACLCVCLIHVGVLQYLCWVELVVISMMNPQASFVGHLCGILAGLIHVKWTSKLYHMLPRSYAALLQVLSGRRTVA